MEKGKKRRRGTNPLALQSSIEGEEEVLGVRTDQKTLGGKQKKSDNESKQLSTTKKVQEHHPKKSIRK